VSPHNGLPTSPHEVHHCPYGETAFQGLGDLNNREGGKKNLVEKAAVVISRLKLKGMLGYGLKQMEGDIEWVRFAL